MVLRFPARWLVVVGLASLFIATALIYSRMSRLPITAVAAAASCQEAVERQFAWPASTGAAGDRASPSVTDPDKLHIFIDRYTQRLTLYEGLREVVSYPVALGKPETPTPPGEWRVVHKDRGWGGGFGTRWMGLNVPWGIYGIHGTNKPGSIGTFASAGCIRMFNKDVEELFDLVPLGTPVTITGDLPSVAPRDEFRRDASGKPVLVLQVRLRQAGFDYGAMDARFGPAVEEAVRNFQFLYGLPADGVVNRDQQRILRFPR